MVKEQAPIEGYEELFLTRNEKARLEEVARERNLSASGYREFARRILARQPQEAEDRKRLEGIRYEQVYESA